MKRVLSLIVVSVMLMMSASLLAVADNAKTLEELIKESEAGTTTQTQNVENQGNISNGTNNSTPSNDNSTTGNSTNNNTTNSTVGGDHGRAFAEGLNEASDLASADIAGVSTVTAGAKQVAGWIVQVLSYVVIVFLAVRVVLDLTYIALPFTRTFLSNGYSGQAQSSGNMVGNAGMGGMGMASGMGGMGVMGGMGMPGAGMGMGGMGMRGGYGMNRMGGMGGNMMNSMAGQNAMMNRNQNMIGSIQFVSNAALNAVATESMVGPDGKTMSPFRIYSKDMIVTLTIVPILMLLAATGIVSRLGFAIGGFLVDSIAKLSSMI